MPRAVTIGECMVEVSPAADGLYRVGFAGDTFNMAFYLRQALPPAWDVDFASATGDDAMSDRLVAFAAECGIGTAHIARKTGAAPGLYLISLQDGERSFSYWRGQSAAKALADDPARLAAALGGAALVLFSGITLAILPPDRRDVLLSAIRTARAAGSLVAFDPNIRRRLWTDDAEACEWITKGAATADTVLPSGDDEAALFGDRDAAATVMRYRGAGCTTVVVKQGADPVVAWDSAEGDVRQTPDRVGSVVDTTAAGDSFNAAFLAARLRGVSMPRALVAGCRTAATVIRAPGALVQLGDAPR